MQIEQRVGAVDADPGLVVACARALFADTTIGTPFDALQTESDDPRCAADHLTLPVRIQLRVNPWISAA
jgi:hypothetical protein